MIMEHDQSWAFICDHVFDGKRPVRLVVHDRDGDWQLTCGEFDHDFSNAKLICSACALDQFSEFAKHQALAPGFLAEWVEEGWQIAAHDLE